MENQEKMKKKIAPQAKILNFGGIKRAKIRHIEKSEEKYGAAGENFSKISKCY